MAKTKDKPARSKQEVQANWNAALSLTSSQLRLTRSAAQNHLELLSEDEVASIAALVRQPNQAERIKAIINRARERTQTAKAKADDRGGPPKT